jgi:hypothetical protein
MKTMKMVFGVTYLDWALGYSAGGNGSLHFSGAEVTTRERMGNSKIRRVELENRTMERPDRIFFHTNTRLRARRAPSGGGHLVEGRGAWAWAWTWRGVGGRGRAWVTDEGGMGWNGRAHWRLAIWGTIGHWTYSVVVGCEACWRLA